MITRKYVPTPAPASVPYTGPRYFASSGVPVVDPQPVKVQKGKMQMESERDQATPSRLISIV